MKKILLSFVLFFFVLTVVGQEDVKIILKDVVKLNGYSNVFGLEKYDPASYKVIPITIPKGTHEWYYCVRVIEGHDGIFNTIANILKGIGLYYGASNLAVVAIEIGQNFVNYLSPEDCTVFLMENNPHLNGFISNYDPLKDTSSVECFQKYSKSKVSVHSFKINTKLYTEDTTRYIVICNDNRFDNITVEIDAAAAIKY